MPFSTLLGNPGSKALLARLIEQKTLARTLLFAGPKGVGKMLFAREAALQLLKTSKTHPADLHIYAPTGKSALHTMETIRELISEAAMAPFEAPVKVFIIDEAERMQPASSNALLKTLEEPPENTYFILISSEPEQLLDTLLSRCAKIPFFPVAEREIGTLLQHKFQLSSDEAAKVALLAQGSISKAFALAEKKENKISALVHELFAEGNLSVAKELEELVPQEEEGSLIEEIAYLFREKDRTSKKPSALLERLLPLLEDAKLALERHVKLSAVLQFLYLKMVRM